MLAKLIIYFLLSGLVFSVWMWFNYDAMVSKVKLLKIISRQGMSIIGFMMGWIMVPGFIVITILLIVQSNNNESNNTDQNE